METALRDLLAAENRLRWLLGWAATDGDLLRPVDRPTVAHVEFDWSTSHLEALARSAELRAQRWRIKQAETELIVARNQLLPQLDLVARYRWLGIGDELIGSPRRGLNFIDDATGLPTSGSYAWDELTEGNYQEVRFGLEFTPPPIGARREHAGVRNSQLKIQREQARLEDMELNASSLLTTAVQNLEYYYQNAQTHFNRWLAAEREVDALSALVGEGMESIDLVLDGHRRRANAQADFYRSIVEYNKAIANVHFRKGTLLDFNNVQLAEGPWPDKAYWDALGRARQRDASHYLDYGSTRPRVISRGPVPQGQTGDVLEGSYESWEDGLPPGAEQIPTPRPAWDAPGDELLEPMVPLELQPEEMGTDESIFEGPALDFGDDVSVDLQQEINRRRQAVQTAGHSNTTRIHD